jgi:uncharacterized protein YkwD
VFALSAAVVLAVVQAAPLAAAATAPAASAAPAAAMSPSPGDESAFVSRINSLRASKGLSQLQVYGELTSVARNWTERMVGAGQISHNPNLGNEVTANWTKLGENVGVGSDVDGLMQAFINSPAHYRNLVDPDFNYVGVGVVISSDGRMYTTHNFMKLAGGGGGGGAPAPAPAPRPRTTRPPSQPRTATTTPVGPAVTPTTAPPKPKPEPQRVATVLAALRTIAG